MSEVSMTAPEAAPVAMPQTPETEVTTSPEPIKVAPQPAPEKPSLRDSLAKAKETVETKAVADEKADPKAKPVEAKTPTDKPEIKTEAKEPVKAEQPRDNGKFAPKPGEGAEAVEKPSTPVKSPEGHDHKAAPTRFTAEAREAWAAIPEHVQAETHRAFRELEAGIQKYKEPATKYEAYRGYDELAAKHGLDAKATLDGYVKIDQMIHSQNGAEKLRGIVSVLEAAGVTPEQFARHVLGQGAQQQPSGQQQPSQPSREVLELRQTVAELKQQLGPVTQHIQTQVSQQHEATLAEYAKDKPHFNELLPVIRSLVVDDGLLPDDAYVKALTEAQDKARAFLGDSALKTPSPKPAELSADELEAQTLKGSKSLKGAPSAGSDPAVRKPSSSVRDSLRKALQAAG